LPVASRSVQAELSLVNGRCLRFPSDLEAGGANPLIHGVEAA